MASNHQTDLTYLLADSDSRQRQRLPNTLPWAWKLKWNLYKLEYQCYNSALMTRLNCSSAYWDVLDIVRLTPLLCHMNSHYKCTIPCHTAVFHHPRHHCMATNNIPFRMWLAHCNPVLLIWLAQHPCLLAMCVCRGWEYKPLRLASISQHLQDFSRLNSSQAATHFSERTEKVVHCLW